VNHPHPLPGILRQHRLHQVDDQAAGRRAQHGLRLLQRHPLAGRGKLVEEGDGVAHRAGSLPGYEQQRVIFDGDIFLGGHALEVGEDFLDRDAAEFEALHARENGGRDLVHLGSGQDEHRVGGGLFQGLEQRVERCGGEHVHLVDDIDLIGALGGGKVDLLAQVAHVIDGGIRGGVDLDQVEEAPLVDGPAVRAGIARPVGGVWVEAVERLGQQAGGGGLSRAARASKQVGMPGMPGAHSIAQGLDHVFLGDNLIPPLRAPLAIVSLAHKRSVDILCERAVVEMLR